MANATRSSLSRRLGCRAGLLGLAIVTGAHAADTAAPASSGGSLGLTDLIASSLSDKTVTLGIAYWQGTYKVRQDGNSSNRAELTDNGAPSPILSLSSRERRLYAWPLVTGNAIVGWDVNGTLGLIDTKYQSVTSGIHGQNVGTRVRGAYVGVAPTLFLKLGPLSADRDIFWKLALGVGPGLLRASGTADFSALSAPPVSVGSRSATLGLYTYGTVQVQVGHWEYGFSGRGISPSGGKPTYESYGLGAAYRFDW
jgi:hypothetical protein